jgi:hypothetical protein
VVRLSLIIPTCGRPSLYSTLHGAWTEGLTKEDQVLVIGDGPQPEAKRIASFFHSRLNIAYHEGPLDHCVGHPQRNFGMKLATGTHLWSFDDDDVFTKDAIRTVRNHVAEAPERIHMFRIKAVSKRLCWDVIWNEPAIRFTNVGTPTIVAPNNPEKLGTWGQRYEGDFDFVSSTAKLHQKPPVWHQEVIANIQ